ncbi:MULTISPECIES: secondary thiamine-phosphate synthase enzyme YjbQ [Marichromatium]|uniref:Secondary thiamine-phosphate synthase enzyme n=1 Tax=Marichromatium gracile TaxID=1048 RepID=A0A4R4A6Q0_MARGR|nr:secondary thiamine-phosphate synthase enzyme YjbQ [Marichromatium gracile]MBK1708594.1 secondary thiamine-phosphate synthase [Marichromatium gracile]MBO8084697.1 YjbQ family protein [Marichromatium sp.]TCW34477.1 secondary thiamine-phosphate synthase enzyme [Marichromatium gracile]
MIEQHRLSIATRGRGTYEITDAVQQRVCQSAIVTGLCHVFVHHTSASLLLCENADPSVRHDLEHFLARLAPDGDPVYTHAAEGPDDMPAHLRAILTKMDLTLPISDGRCALGTWQGVYLYEHRTGAQRRRLTLTLNGV